MLILLLFFFFICSFLPVKTGCVSFPRLPGTPPAALFLLSHADSA